MANTPAAFGFRQFRHFDGSAPTAGFDTVNILSSDTSVIFTGDPVVTSTLAIQGFGNYVTGATSGLSQIRGIFFGCEFFSPTVGRKVWSPFFPGSVQTSCGTADAQAWVCTDPDMLYSVQVSSGTTGASTTTVLTSSLVNLNFGWSSASIAGGNLTTGVSNVTLAATSFATTNTLPFRLIDFYSNSAPPGSNGTDNTTNGQFVIVAPNNWDRKNTTAV